MQAINRVFKNTAILYARMAITVVISLYSTRLILNALGAEDFGLFNLVGGAIAMLGFLNGSMAAATQRFISFSQGAGDFEKVKRIFNMSILLNAGVAILAVVLLEIAGYFFFHSVFNISPDRVGVGKLIYQFMVASTFVTILSVPYEAVITSHENMLFFAVISILEAVLKLAIAFYITYAKADHLYLYGLMTAILSVILLIIRRIYCKRKYPECAINVKQHYDMGLFKEMTGFAGWSLLGSASSMIANYGQGIVLNMFFGTLVNAAQGISSQISGQLAVFSLTLVKVVNPIIDKSEGGKNREGMLNAAMALGKFSFILMMILYIPFMIEAKFIFTLWLKTIPDYTIIFCRLLFVKLLIEYLFSPLNLAIMAVGKIKSYQIISTILTIFPLPISIVFFYFKFPPFFLYIIFLIYAIANSVIVLYFAKINCKLSIKRFITENVLVCFFSSLILLFSCLIPFILMESSIFRALFVFFIALAEGLLVIYFKGVSVNQRKDIFKSMRLKIKALKFSF